MIHKHGWLRVNSLDFIKKLITSFNFFILGLKNYEYLNEHCFLRIIIF